MLPRFTSALLFLIFVFLHFQAYPAVRSTSRENSAPQFQPEKQSDGISNVRFLNNGSEYTTYFTPNGMILAGFTPAPRKITQPPKYFELKILLQNALPDVEITTLNPRPAHPDFFGSPHDSWSSNIPAYAKVQYRNLYPAVDMLVRMDQRKLDFDFVIAPGGDPHKIRIQVQGTEDIQFTSEGALLLNVQNLTFEVSKPEGYQVYDGSSARRVVDAGFILSGKNEIGLKVAPYDSNRTIIIRR